MTRPRQFLVAIAFILIPLVLMFFCLTPLAAAADSNSYLRDRLSQFPQWTSPPRLQTATGDLVYPEWFAGEWTVQTRLLDMVAPLAPTIVSPGFESNRQFLNRPIEFQVRFLPTRSSALNANPLKFLPQLLDRRSALVADRAFNGLSLAKAYLGDRMQIQVKIDPNNPNRQVTFLGGDRQLVSTITARATEMSNPDDFITSELFLQEFRGAPQLYFNQVENTTAYHKFSTPVIGVDRQPWITADQVTAIYLSPQDPDYFKAQMNLGELRSEPAPVALYRYRLDFYRDAD